MGHPQPPTPIQMDNTTMEGVINNKIQPKWTKAMDMRFHWLRNCEQWQQFQINWKPGGQIWQIIGPSIMRQPTT
jgi:hypothetical protein